MQINKENVARGFLGGMETYDQHATVQKKISQKLIAALAECYEVPFRRVLEVGCCTGFLTEAFCQQYSFDTFFLNDLVPQFEGIVRDKLLPEISSRVKPLFGDIESLALPAHLDLVMSSSTLQWLTDLSGFFHRVAEGLNENGYLAFSLFNTGTLAEFSALTGVGLNYVAHDDIVAALDRHFAILQSQTYSDTLMFTEPRAVLRHIQATGVGGAGKHRWTRSGLREFEQNYLTCYGTPEGVPVSYTSSIFVCKKR